MVYDVWLFYIYTVEEILACCSRNVAHGDLLKWSVTRNQKNYNGHLGKPSQKGWMDQLVCCPNHQKCLAHLLGALLFKRGSEVNKSSGSAPYCGLKIQYKGTIPIV